MAEPLWTTTHYFLQVLCGGGLQFPCEGAGAPGAARAGHAGGCGADFACAFLQPLPAALRLGGGSIMPRVWRLGEVTRGVCCSFEAAVLHLVERCSWPRRAICPRPALHARMFTSCARGDRSWQRRGQPWAISCAGGPQPPRGNACGSWPPSTGWVLGQVVAGVGGEAAPAASQPGSHPCPAVGLAMAAKAHVQLALRQRSSVLCYGMV